ncbi:MAG: hypothetical protein ACOC9Z_04910 [Chloroflexota bacterium]
MRKLIHELPYERPVAAGRFEYFENGLATGAVEVWQLNAARDGYRFLRVDLNAAASSGDNVLFHLAVDAEGRPQRLKFHFFRQGAQVRGDVLFDEDRALLTREVDGRRVESEAAFATARPFWFPSGAGLGLLAKAQSGAGLTLRREAAFDLWPVDVVLQEGPEEMVTVMGREVQTRQLRARWEHEERVLWLDEAGWPVRVRRGDLVAQERRYVRYRQDD